MTGECTFNLVHWRSVLLQALSMGYRFCSFDDYAGGVSATDPTILLRHDVDVSLTRAVRLAELETSLGVWATYFIRLQSRFYQPMDPQSQPQLHRLSEMNVGIGLHYDRRFYEKSGQDEVEMLSRDVAALSRALGRPVEICAAHRSGSLSPLDAPTVKRAGLLHEAYASSFFAEPKYISDSRGSWREGCLCQWLDRAPHLTVVTHPIWWVRPRMDRDRLLVRLGEGD